jgi:hypothetical protein
MVTRSILSRLVAAVLASAVALPAASGALYKTIDADGRIMFSDVPPHSGAPTFEQSRIPGASGAANAEGMPYYEMPEQDAALASANERLDLAEHALALARQVAWSPRDGLRMIAARTTQGDRARAEFYKKDVRSARRQLTDLLRERQALAQPVPPAPPAQLASR